MNPRSGGKQCSPGICLQQQVRRNEPALKVQGHLKNLLRIRRIQVTVNNLHTGSTLTVLLCRCVTMCNVGYTMIITPNNITSTWCRARSRYNFIPTIYLLPLCLSTISFNCPTYFTLSLRSVDTHSHNRR